MAMIEAGVGGGSSWQGGRGWRTWLAVGLAVLVLLVLVLARCAGGSDPETGSGAPRATSVGDDSVADISTAPTAPPAPALQAATNFTREWLQYSPGESERQWWQRVSPYAEPGFARQLQLTDPARVPGSRLRGEPVPVSISENRVVLRLDTDAGGVVVTCVRVGAQGGAPSQVWKVSDVESVQGTDTAATG
ncbi:MAG: hypothetical protein ACRDPW_03205 [Mycobacteriales bacterium]